MRHAWVRRLSQAGLMLLLVAWTGGALADETVTLTTFYPQQPAQTTALAAAQACNGTLANFRITTTNQGRLLILWSLDITNGSPNPNAYVSGRVVVGGAASGPSIRSMKLGNSDSQTISGHLVVVPAVVATTIDLACTVSAGNATVNAANTTLSVIELK